MVIIFLLIVAIVLTITLVTESFGIAAIEFAVAMIIFNLWIIPKAYLIWWAFLLGNWPLVLLIFVGYFALGTVWSFYRWFVFLRAKQRQYPGNSRSNYTASNYSDKIVGWIVAWHSVLLRMFLVILYSMQHVGAMSMYQVSMTKSVMLF